MTFSVAEENFHTAARDGLAARVWWPRLGEVGVTDLVCDVLLPLAYEALRRATAAWRTADRHFLVRLTPAEAREGVRARLAELPETERAVWQAEVVRYLEEDRGMDRMAALREMLRRYSGYLHGNDPVHTWPMT